jgi:glyoxylase-like metal-dependent hydrolase (beta-lactamase superfamily II)
MELKQVSKSTWAVVDGSTFGNVGCIRIPNHIVIIDTGMTPRIAKEFHSHIQQDVGTPITEVILTHYHSDHVFGAQEFQQYPLFASAKMAEQYPALLEERWSPKGIEEMRKAYAETEPELSRQLENLQIITPDNTFEISLTLGENEEIQVTHTGGHTAGHATVYYVPERILFAGDLIFCQEYPYAGDPTNNPPEWMKVFEVILEMDVDTIVPGHGPLCDKAEIRTQLTYFKKLEAWILEKLAQGLSSEAVLEKQDSGPAPPYDVKAERRMAASIERWYNFYSTETG